MLLIVLQIKLEYIRSILIIQDIFVANNAKIILVLFELFVKIIFLFSST